MNVRIRDGFETPHHDTDLRVLIDVFRASTTTLAVLESRPQEMLIANNFEFLADLNKQGYHIISEVFDIGIDNSPTLVKKMNLLNQKVALKTANLTTAIENNVFDGVMLIGCFNNLGAITNFIREGFYQNVELIPAGLMEPGKRLLEDTHCAETLYRRLTEDPKAAPDANLLSSHVEEKIHRHPRSEHYIQDMHLAIQPDISTTIPTIVRPKLQRNDVFCAKPLQI